MRIYLVILLLLVFFSCQEKKRTKDEKVYFVIHQNDSSIKAKRASSDTKVLMFFYGDYNFILNDEQTVYFYRANWNKGGTGVENSKPKRLYLTPDSFTQISIDSLDSFLRKTLKPSSNKEILTASISSLTDTIKSQAFPIITKYFRKNNIQRYAIRLLTEEERYVIEAKLKNKHYNPDSIEWKIGFDSSFIPPVPTDIEN